MSNSTQFGRSYVRLNVCQTCKSAHTFPENSTSPGLVPWRLSVQGRRLAKKAENDCMFVFLCSSFCEDKDIGVAEVGKAQRWEDLREKEKKKFQHHRMGEHTTMPTLTMAKTSHFCWILFYADLGLF